MTHGSDTQLDSTMLLRDAVDADLATVHALNEQSVPAVNSLAPDRLVWLAREAAYFRVATFGMDIAGFLLCLSPEVPYDSPNFGWVKARYDDFLYIDRVAVASQYHRRGVARALYRDAASLSGKRFRLLAAEVNTRPRNDGSLRFHASMGFEAVGSQDHGYVQVQYFVRSLPL